MPARIGQPECSSAASARSCHRPVHGSRWRRILAIHVLGQSTLVGDADRSRSLHRRAASGSWTRDASGDAEAITL
jgi:hypothetical protein